MKLLSTSGLSRKANEIRIDIVRMIATAGSGHPGGALGIADIMTALYFRIMNHDPKKPNWEDRDHLILSNGHVCPAQYAALAHAGYFSTSKLTKLRQLGSPLQGHPERGKLAGVETTSGPLGSGLAQAVGMAICARGDDKRFRVFCITSDGEHDEGNHWEAVLLASKYKLSNLTLFVDRNSIQIDGPTESILPLEPLVEKYKAFGWNALEIDGHDFGQIISSAERAREYYQGPTVIIATTIPGKGVSFMEGDYAWHGKAPTKEEAKKALAELRKK